jgi:phosphoribosylanthranilate isomerase
LSRLIIQIYEIQTPQEAEAVIALGVDRIGSVMLSGENGRMPGLKDTIDLVRKCGATSSLIPLVQCETRVLQALEFYRPDIVHFCDALAAQSNPPQGLGRLIKLQIRVKELFPEMKVMRSIPVAPAGNAHRAATLEFGRRFEPVTDIFLIDTLLVGNPAAPVEAQPVSGFVGITGRTCDWDMARRLVRQCRIPVILAGGISPENAAEAIRRTRPAGIDSCTQTNAVDARGRPIRFRKDLKKIQALVTAVRRTELLL